MVKVVLWGGLRHLADGTAELEIEATTIHQVITRLGADYPRLQTRLKESISVAVDGQIYWGSWFVSLKPDAEVFLFPKIVGG